MSGLGKSITEYAGDERDFKDFHGAEIRIFQVSEPSKQIYHESRGSSHITTPTIRSYQDGIRIGCSFLTTKALEQIYQWHRDFLETPDSKTHQIGNYA